MDISALTAALAGLACLDALPAEPTLAQARVIRPPVQAVLDLDVTFLAVGCTALMAITLSEREHRELTIAWEKVKAYSEAGQITTLADFADVRTERVAREVAAGGTDRWQARSGPSSIGHEIALPLGVALGSATAKVTAACHVAGRLPAALDALTEARMRPGHLTVLREITRDLLGTVGAADTPSPDLIAQLEAEAVRLAPSRTATQLRTELAELAARLDPTYLAQAAAKGAQRRDMWMGRSSTPGMARLVMELPAGDAYACLHALNAVVRAAKAAGDQRAAGQLRADYAVGAITGLVRAMLDEAIAARVAFPVPTRQDIAGLFTINVVVPTDTDPADGTGTDSAAPADTGGSGGTGGPGSSGARPHPGRPSPHAEPDPGAGPHPEPGPDASGGPGQHDGPRADHGPGVDGPTDQPHHPDEDEPDDDDPNAPNDGDGDGGDAGGGPHRPPPREPPQSTPPGRPPSDSPASDSPPPQREPEPIDTRPDQEDPDTFSHHHGTGPSGQHPPAAGQCPLPMPSGGPPDLPDPDPPDHDPHPDACHPDPRPPEAGGPLDPAYIAVDRALIAGWDAPAPVSVPGDLVAACRVAIVIAATTLTGRNEHPASLPGHGPLDATSTRALARHAAYRWLHVDAATGYLVHRHTRRHQPPPPGRGWDTPTPPTPPPLPEQVSAAMRQPGYVPGTLLRAHVELRDATCIGTACHHPARGADLDHTINHHQTRDGVPGLTTAANLGPACRRVHLHKTHGGWLLEQTSPGTFHWRSPLGATSTRTARPVLPGWNHLTRTSR